MFPLALDRRRRARQRSVFDVTDVLAGASAKGHHRRGDLSLWTGRVDLRNPRSTHHWSGSTGQVFPGIPSHDYQIRKAFTMRYLMVYKPGKDGGSPPQQQELERMGRFIEEMVKEGVLLDTNGLLPSSLGTRVRISGGKFTVTDGPFAETKELIGGYAIVRANSMDHAIDLAKRFLAVTGEGETEIRQIAEASDFGEEFTPELREAEERWCAGLTANQ
jgi:hypothetical protein